MIWQRTGEDKREGDAGARHALDIDVIRHDSNIDTFTLYTLQRNTVNYSMLNLKRQKKRENKDQVYPNVTKLLLNKHLHPATPRITFHNLLNK